MKRFISLAAGAALIAAQMGMAQMGAPGERIPSMSGQPGPLAAKYKADADKIIAAAMADKDGYAALAYLTDHIGKRLSGSPPLNTAVEWGAELMKKAGLENVQVQSVTVPHWVRGNESATITYKGQAGTIVKPLHMLGLGMSVGTAKGGITAPAVFVHDFAELDKLSDADVKGKIVVFNPGWHGYGVGSMYRTGGPSRAAAKGAEVFGVDLTMAIDAAYRNIGHLDNVHLFQADIFALPFRQDAFDLAYSIGVLHHTPDPAAAFDELVREVQSGV